jgi:MtaA/CmuA family methyltransferase
VDRLKPVDVGSYKYVQIWLEAVAMLKRHFGREIYVRGNCDQAPFSLASMMRSPQEWLMDLMTDEEKVHQLLLYCTGIVCQFITLMAQTGADMVSSGDSPAGPEMISPTMYEKFGLPYEKKIIDCAHALQVPYTLHICGNTNTILELMATSGADAVELDYKTDAVRARNVLKDQTTFIGNIDPSGVLALGKPVDVRRATTELLKVFADKKRFILNAGCALPSTTPSENLREMVRVAREWK